MERRFTCSPTAGEGDFGPDALPEPDEDALEREEHAEEEDEDGDEPDETEGEPPPDV